MANPGGSLAAKCCCGCSGKHVSSKIALSLHNRGDPWDTCLDPGSSLWLTLSDPTRTLQRKPLLENYIEPFKGDLC